MKNLCKVRWFKPVARIMPNGTNNWLRCPIMYCAHTVNCTPLNRPTIQWVHLSDSLVYFGVSNTNKWTYSFVALWLQHDRILCFAPYKRPPLLLKMIPSGASNPGNHCKYIYTQISLNSTSSNIRGQLPRIIKFYNYLLLLREYIFCNSILP